MCYSYGMSPSEWRRSDDIDELIEWYLSRQYREVKRMKYQRIMVCHMMYEARKEGNIPLVPEDLYPFADDEQKEAMEAFTPEQIEANSNMWTKIDNTMKLPTIQSKKPEK